VPWGLIDAPVTLCRPRVSGNLSGLADYGTAAETVRPAAWSRSPEVLHARAWSGLVMVLWHDCQIDKWLNRDDGRNDSRAFAAIAPVNPLANQSPDIQDAIREGRHFSYFPVQAVDNGPIQMVESYVDLRHVWSVRQSVLTDRILSLTERARFSLYEHLFTFLTRLRLDVDATCPECGTHVPLRPAGDE
jgi:hypothetical protein